MSIHIYSIIIPTYNRVKTLVLTLESVCNQMVLPEKYEILIIDDGSTDSTKETVSLLKIRFPKHIILYFYQPNSGVAKARNIGIKNASGEFLFFTDDDCVVPRNWMESLIDGYARYPDVLGVGGWHKPASKNIARMYLQRYMDFQNSTINYSLYDLEIRTNMFFHNFAGNTSNMSYKKKVFEELGGFDENLYFTGAVDWEFKMRAQSSGYYLLYLPIFVSHFKKLTFFTFIKKHFNQGRGKYYMSLKYPRYYNFFDVDQVIQGLFFYFFNKIRFFPAHCLLCVSMFFGKLFVCAVKPFENIYLFSSSFKENTYETICRNVQNGRISVTRFFQFIKKSEFSKTGVLFQENRSPIVSPITKTQFLIQYSIIVPTYNRHKNLLQLLESLVAQTFAPSEYEIIIIDDGSTDATKATVTEFQSKYSRNTIRYFFQNNSGPAIARNKGIKESKGSTIFFTDDDCIVPHNWMETLLEGFKRHHEVVGVGGWTNSPGEELKKSATARYYERSELQGGYEVISNNPMRCFSVSVLNTANIAYKKEILEKVGGFNPQFYWPGSEDTDLAFRIMLSNQYLLYIPFNVIHSKAMSLFSFLKVHFKRGANGYFLRKIHNNELEKLKPGFVKNYGSIGNFTLFLGRPEKLLAFLGWLSLNVGIMYMENRLSHSTGSGLTKNDHPILTKPEEKIGSS